jgi:hypothetical protein
MGTFFALLLTIYFSAFRVRRVRFLTMEHRVRLDRLAFARSLLGMHATRETIVTLHTVCD